MIQLVVVSLVGAAVAGYAIYRWWSSPSQELSHSAKNDGATTSGGFSPETSESAKSARRATGTSKKIERNKRASHPQEPIAHPMSTFHAGKFGISEETTSYDVIKWANTLNITDNDLASMLRCNSYTIKDYRTGLPILKTYRHYELCRTFVSLGELLDKKLGCLQNEKEEIKLWMLRNIKRMKNSPPVQDFKSRGLDRIYLTIYTSHRNE